MTRLIETEKISDIMHKKSFETDDGRQKWHSGLWIRYKIFEEAVDETPTADAVPVDFIKKEIEKMRNSENPAMRMNSVILSALIRNWREKNG